MTPPDQGSRRLAAILAADAVGYSRLMADDERATVVALQQARGTFRILVEKHGGRLLDTAGDSVMAIFASVVEAATCALALQRALSEWNGVFPPERRMLFRIGVALGDVIEQADGSVFGDGVNVAARLQALAAPGAVVLSEDAYRQIEGKVTEQFVDAGTHSLKNIAKPVRVYRSTGGVQVDEKKTGLRRVLRPRSLAVSVVVVVLTFVAAHWMGWKDGRDSLDPSLAVPTGPSIAVIPFDNLSGNAKDSYFVDGLYREVVASLGRFRELRVIARESTAAYRDGKQSISDIRQELNAQYVVRGSVRRSGKAVVVAAQLFDAQSGTQIWGERFERSMKDVTRLQDEVASQIVGALGGSYGAIARNWRERTQPRDPAAYDYVLRADNFYTVMSEQAHRDSRSAAEKAVALDPAYPRARSILAFMYLEEHRWNYNRLPDSLKRAEAEALKGYELDPSDPDVLTALAHVYFTGGQVDRAIMYGDRAVAAMPNDPNILASIGFMYAASGRDLDKGVALAQKAIELNPRGPGWYPTMLTIARYMSGSYREALLEAQKLSAAGTMWTYIYLAATYGQLGELDRAGEAIGKLRAMRPDIDQSIEQEFKAWNFSQEIAGKYLEGLRKAGMQIPGSRPRTAVEG